MSSGIPVRWITDGTRLFTDMPDNPDNPCTACGACCAHFRVSFYCGELTGGSGGWVPAHLTSKVNNTLACMKGTEAGHGRCVALIGDPGRAGVRCGIYPQRPSPCREFSAWRADGAPDPECQRVRALFGLPPLAPLPPRESPEPGGATPASVHSSIDS